MRRKAVGRREGRGKKSDRFAVVGEKRILSSARNEKAPGPPLLDRLLFSAGALDTIWFFRKSTLKDLRWVRDHLLLLSDRNFVTSSVKIRAIWHILIRHLKSYVLKCSS